MKALVPSFMALTIAAAMAGPAQGRNVQLLVPIADAMEISKVSDRPTGAVKLLFATEKSPEILKNLGSYIAAPEPALPLYPTKGRVVKPFSEPSSISINARNGGGNAVANIVSHYEKKEMTRTSKFERHVENVVVMVWLEGELVKIAQ
jgi:hypothetical protein